MQIPFRLPYGRRGVFDCAVEPERLAASLQPPPGLREIPQLVAAAAAAPLGCPPLAANIVPGDRIAVVLDTNTPEADQLLLGLWRSLQPAGVSAEDILIVRLADLSGTAADPRGALPPEVRERIGLQAHDPLDAEACSYLATSAGGERLYLARQAIDADFVLCVGAIGYDDALGHRGTFSPLYPGLSNADALRKSIGGGHAELSPESPRSARELADEVGWLLGAQFVIQALPAARSGIAAVLAGSAEAVLSAGTELLEELWQVAPARRAELVVASVDVDAGGHGWAQAAAALDVARRLVARDGRILLLTELEEQPTAGLELIRQARSAREALRPIREQATVDRLTALRVAQALDRANVFLLSRLPDELVESLFMMPIGAPEEALRLMAGAADCAVIGSAQHVYVRHSGDEA